MTGELELRHAVALGVLQGPAELLPISSSGHIALAPKLFGWSYADLDPELRKSFEVSIHLRTAAALLIGFAQAFALAPGVPRNGATLAAARWRRFNRRDANVISRQIALPVIVGAGALKGVRLATRGDISPALARGMAAGAAAAFAS